LDREAGPLQEFACDLRELRRRAGSPTYAALAARTYCSKSVLAAAASGKTLPTQAVTFAYVRACGGHVPEWEARWEQVYAAQQARRQRNASLRLATTTAATMWRTT
jgi:hypothetical protein